MKTETRIYFSAFVNSVGSWLTFLALALFVSEKYGSHQVAYVFLIQCLPALLLARGLSELIPSRWAPRIYIFSLFILGLNSAMLVYFNSLSAVYVHLVVGSFVKSISAPLFNALVGLWVPREKQVEVHTRLGSIQAGTLALAPMIGGVISTRFGYQTLFLLDALTFFIAMLVLIPLPKVLQTVIDEIPQKFSVRRMFTQAVRKPAMVQGLLSHRLGIWFLFLAIGAAINAIEFSTFARIALSKDQVGMVIGLWGLGNLLAFMAPKLAEHLRCTQLRQGYFYCAGLVLFVFADAFALAGIGFFIAGFFSATLSGKLRGDLQRSVPAGSNPLPVWVYANQITQAINIVFYLTFGFLLKHSMYHAAVAALILCSLYFLWRFHKVTPVSS